jgi:hypothetical protein
MRPAPPLPVSPPSGPAVLPETLNHFVESLAGRPPSFVVDLPVAQAGDR